MNLIIFGLLFIAILFNSFFEGFLSSHFVNPFLSFCKSNYFNDTLIILLNLFIIFYYAEKIKTNFLASENKYIFLVIFTLLYFYYRFFNTVWRFTEFQLYNPIKYFDTIFISFALNSTLICKNFLKKSTHNININDAFVFDEPIGKTGIDLLGRENYAKEIARRIQLTQSNQSFALGIIGPWGSGKTSFLDLLEKHIKKEDKIIIHFNPWNSSSSKSIISDFFGTLKDELCKYSSKLTKQLLNYSEKLVAIDDSIISKTINHSISFFSTPETLNDQRVEINETIEKLGKQIIVFIDDLLMLRTKTI